MRFLITGGAGFIGSHLSERLLGAGEGHEVVCVDDLSTGSIDNLQGVLADKNFQFVRESVRNDSTMTALVDRCDVIYHLAAAVGVQLIVDQPVHTIETNIHGSEVVLNLANKFGRKIVVASTSEVYGKSTAVPFREDDDVVLGSTRFSRWCYAASKMVDEFLSLAYHEQYGLPAVVCRFFNTVGPRQTGAYGMVIPRFVQAALAGETINIYGTGRQSRCFCNVADVVDALTALIDCEKAVGQVLNVGALESITINDLAKLIIEMTGSASKTVKIPYEQAYGRPFDDMMQRVPDLSRVRELIGYEPKIPLKETLQQVIDFERARMG